MPVQKVTELSKYIQSLVDENWQIDGKKRRQQLERGIQALSYADSQSMDLAQAYRLTLFMLESDGAVAHQKNSEADLLQGEGSD